MKRFFASTDSGGDTFTSEARIEYAQAPLMSEPTAIGMAWRMTSKHHRTSAGQREIDIDEIRERGFNSIVAEVVLGQLPGPKRAFCCAHNPSSAVHQEPHDHKTVDCTCGEPSGRHRHHWSPADLTEEADDTAVQ